MLGLTFNVSLITSWLTTATVAVVVLDAICVTAPVLLAKLNLSPEEYLVASTVSVQLVLSEIPWLFM